MKQYQHITIAGTFDRLHAGHKTFIDYAYKVSKKVSIAITAEDFPYKKILQDHIEPFDIRKKELAIYTKEKGHTDRTAIIPIHDFYGFALVDKTLDGILVTKDTYANAVKINNKRRELGMKKLGIILTPFVKGTDHRIIKSSRIRSGEIDRSGQTYVSRFMKKKVMTLPQDMRQIMRKPLGIIFENEDTAIDHIKKIQPSMVITVGDVVTESFRKQVYNPDVAVIDFKTRRMKLSRGTQNKGEISHINKAGTIQRTAVLSFKDDVRKFIKNNKKSALFIKGEEDLLALPAILLAPLNSVVLYGQFDLGIILTEVTEDKKNRVEDLIKKFT